MISPIEARQLLGSSFQHLSDNEIIHVDGLLQQLAEIIVDTAIENSKMVQKTQKACYDGDATQKAGVVSSLSSPKAG